MDFAVSDCLEDHLQNDL